MVVKVWLCAVLVLGEVVGAPAGAVAAGDAEALGYSDGSGVIAPSGFTSPGLGAADASGDPDGVGVAETVGLGDDVRSGVAITGVGAAVGSAPKPNGVQATAITATHTVSAATISFSIFLLIYIPFPSARGARRRKTTGSFFTRGTVPRAAFLI